MLTETVDNFEEKDQNCRHISFCCSKYLTAIGPSPEIPFGICEQYILTIVLTKDGKWPRG
jgi:hypothetical protein